MNRPLYPIENIFNLNSRLFPNTLSGVSEEQSEERLTEHNNSIKWIAAHTVWARYNTLAFLGKPATNPYNSLFQNFKAYDSSDDYPTISAIKNEWQTVTGLLNEAISTVTEEHLSKDSTVKNPTGDFTNAGILSFFAQHESYDIGQLGLLKKYLTKEAMAYK